MREARKDSAPHDPAEEVPPGRQGADSGAANAVRVGRDGSSRTTAREQEPPDESHGNDIPGVGPRRPDEDGEPTTAEQLDAYRASRTTEIDDETGGAPHLNERGTPGPNRGK